MRAADVPAAETEYECVHCQARWRSPALCTADGRNVFGGCRLAVVCATCQAQRAGTKPEVVIETTLAQSGVPVSYLSARLSDALPHQTQAVDAIRAWVVAGSGVLLVVGPVGSGKTHLAMATVRALVERRAAALVVEMLPFGRRLQSAFRDDSSEDAILSPVIGHQWVIVDDLGSGITSDIIRRSLLALVDERQAHNRPLMITSNWDLQWIADRLDDRIASRLSAGIVVTLDGPDLRHTQQAK